MVGAYAERYEELVEAVAMPVKQEKVKMGFQLYRPPTLITQATPEVFFWTLLNAVLWRA